ncbi:cyclic nucleotide-binding domain-containing protein [bacterium]|nr:MAG: cyclic nucleotide-binding domain-containing protein [bacterium]
MDPVDALRACYAFEGVPDRQLRELAQLSEIRDFATGDTVIEQKEVSSQMYVVLEGEAAMIGTDGEPIVRFKPGTIFGEMALVAGIPRSATIKTTEETRVAQIYAAPVLAMMDNDPRLGYTISSNLARLLCHRLIETNEYIDGISGKPETD